MGCKDGTIYFCNLDTKKTLKTKEESIIEVVDLQWNPGEDLVLAVFANGVVKLFGLD